MRVTLGILAAGLLASLAIGAPASAELAPRIGKPPYRTIADPVFAGNTVVWGRPASDGYELIAQHGSTRTSTKLVVGRLEDPIVSLEASDRRVVLSLQSKSVELVVTGPVGGPLTFVDGCTTPERCESDPCPVRPSVDVWGDAIAYEDCQGVHVRDLAPGASPAVRDYPGRRAPRIAGPWVAATSGTTTTVTNWVTDDDVYSLDTGDVAFAVHDLQEDGTLAFAGPEIHWVSWASPAEPVAHRVAEWPGGPDGVRIANDRIAAAWFDFPDEPLDFEQGYWFDVVGLHQEPPEEYMPRLLDDDALEGIDFDGQRLIWAAHRCRHAWLRTWAAPGAVSGELPRPCPLPRVVRGSPRLDAEHRLRLRLSCDVPPGPACSGEIRRIGRRGRPLIAVGYDIAEGHARTAHLPATGSLCRVARGRARARVLLQDETGSANYRRTVSARGPTAGLPDC